MSRLRYHWRNGRHVTELFLCYFDEAYWDFVTGDRRFFSGVTNALRGIHRNGQRS